jgi:hypothetical protein
MARQGFAEEKEFDVILLREQLGVYHPNDQFTGGTVARHSPRTITRERRSSVMTLGSLTCEPVSFLLKTEREPKKLA